MKNIGLIRIKDNTAESFTTDIGIKVRRMINPVFRRILRMACKRKIIIETYPKLDKEKAYIFCSSHSLVDDVIASLSAVDRSAYILVGTTDQIDYNRQMYAAWLNGIIYVNRLDSESRKESVKKMQRILNSGSSVILFPEGSWNNTENLLIQPLFAGPHTLAQTTGCEVVPMAIFHEHGADSIYIRVGEPFDISGMEKRDGLDLLRDEMATLMYECIEQHSTKLLRKDMQGVDYRLKYMEERRLEYLYVNWTRDVWDEEITFYRDKEYPRPDEVCASFDNVRLRAENAAVMAPVVLRRQEYIKYDFIKYMHENWDKEPNI